MNRMTFAKGIGLGLVVGSAIGMAVMPRRKKSAMGKALKAMGHLVDDVAGSLGL